MTDKKPNRWRPVPPSPLMEQVARRHRELGVFPKDGANHIKFPMQKNTASIDTVTVSVFYLGREGVELPCFRYEYKGDVFALQIDAMVFLRRMEDGK